MLGWGLNIVVGLAGLLDLGYVAFYAVGAYSYALLAKTFGLSFWLLLPLAGILAAFWGILLGFPVLRLRGDYLAIVTLAFGEIIRLDPDQLGRADQRLCRHQRHPAADILRHSVQRRRQRLRRGVRSGILADLPHHLSLLRDPGAGAADRLRHACGCAGCRSAAPGRRCARTRSPAARSASTPPTPSSPPSPWARCSPALPARSSPRAQGFISPESFTFMESATILAIVVLGGMGSQIGVVIAAIAMIGGTEMLRELDFLKQIFGADFRSDPVPHAAVRLRHGADHDLAAARADLDARAVGVPRRSARQSPPIWSRKGTVMAATATPCCASSI